MTLTVEKKIKESIEINLSQPQYRKLFDDIFIKFFQDGDKVKVIRHSNLGYFSLDSRIMLECDHSPLMLDGSWDSTTKEEFDSVLQQRLKEYHVI